MHIGSEHIYRYLNSLVTEGIMFLAEKANSYWLLDLVISHQTNPILKNEEFQVWKLFRVGDEWRATADDGNDNILVSQDIAFSDFPLDEIKLYFTNNTLLLPSEY